MGIVGHFGERRGLAVDVRGGIPTQVRPYRLAALMTTAPVADGRARGQYKPKRRISRWMSVGLVHGDKSKD
jgi:hypothetical protein